jgi:HNH endonuclease
MCGTCTELDERLEVAERLAAPLPSRLPRVRDPALGRWIAEQLDVFLRNVTACRRALDIAVGEGLDALDVGRRTMDLGYSNIGDYAREELGINASTAAKMARLARKLRERPLVRDAVRRGELTPRKAEVIAPVAVGKHQTRWILRAKAETVRSLQAAVKAPADPADEEWVNLTADVSPEQLSTLNEGLRLTGVILGAAASRMQKVQAWAQERLGSDLAPGLDAADDVLFSSADDFDSIKKVLEEQNRQWTELVAVKPAQAPHSEDEIDPWRIDRELKRHLRNRTRWDDVFGHVATIFKRSRAWEQLGFADFGHYCEEQLGMAERTVMQRIALEYSLQKQPLLRRALREKRISYEQARIIARHAKKDELDHWIEKAQTMTCVALRRALQEKTEEQMCARGTFGVWMTISVAEVVKAAFRATRAEAKRWLSAGECLVEMATHFIETWRAHLKEANTIQKRVRARDRGFCQVPGCSRAAVHCHHIVPRSQGGTDDPENLVSLCAAHHLYGIHGGRMRVSGTAPDNLTWQFELRRSHSAADTAMPA